MIDLSYISGRITHNDLKILNNHALSEQVENLKEDMLQAEYKSNLLLDVGWYPSFNINGHFQIKIIRNHEWDDPIFSTTAHTLENLNIELREAQKTMVQLENHTKDHH
ncbi:hypothetical protein HX890_00860 [Pseudomonas gingeri]|uniref:hypothetical protein n=1 Tax=Pseudomonas gingeri TaxID=117681 RepID=UPI0015A3BD04|nr:hypothetical protein [Pseudomonas gingeri]NWD72671.1 hypothetical protein [Pseudomonas gingeri]